MERTCDNCIYSIRGEQYCDAQKDQTVAVADGYCRSFVADPVAIMAEKHEREKIPCNDCPSFAQGDCGPHLSNACTRRDAPGIMDLAAPLAQYLKDNYPPHTKIVIGFEGVEVLKQERFFINPLR